MIARPHSLQAAFLALSSAFFIPVLAGESVLTGRFDQSKHSSKTVVLLDKVKFATHPSVRGLRSGCATSFASSFYMKGSILLLFFAAFIFTRTKSGSGKRQIVRNISLSIFTMALFAWVSFLLTTVLLPPGSSGQPWDTTHPWSPPVAGTMTTTDQSSSFTVPPSADLGMNIIPNVKDPQAVDPQAVCPGYKASNIQESDKGFTADLRLAGSPCNVYGNDIEDLTLHVRFQAADRVHVQIQPRYIGSENETWFILPEVLVPQALDGAYNARNQMSVTWSNEPTFSFTVKREGTGDVLFTSEGRVLVFEDQFIEFGSSLPDNYNLYGIGEVFRGFRLGNNLTREYFCTFERTCGISMLTTVRDDFCCGCW